MPGTPPRRVVLVTGANRGIGLETCSQLVRSGCRVVMTGRNQAQLDKAARSLRADDVVAVPMDVADTRSIAEAKQMIDQRVGAVDAIVNNAAILLHESSDALEIPLEAYQQTIHTTTSSARLKCAARSCRIWSVEATGEW